MGEPIVVDVDPELLEWPPEGAPAASAGSNRTYSDLRYIGWRDVDAAISMEESLLENEAEPSDGERNDDSDEDAFFDEFGVTLDVGVASATFALNAAKCATSMSCSGHGRHAAYVQFWSRPAKVPLIVDAAKCAGVGLVNHDGGGLEVFTEDPCGMLRFARELRARSGRLRQARAASAPRPARRAVAATSPQTSLPLGDVG
jgi:hypothetical protein